MMKIKHHSKVFKPSILAIAVASAPFAVQAAFDDEGTAYDNAKQRYHLWNEALEPVELVNSILCFSNQMRAEQFINQGAYMALVNESACFDNDESNSQSSANKQPKFVTAIVNSVRESADDPLTVNVWLPQMQVGDGDGAIRFKAVISEGATDDNPFGAFTFNYGFFQSINDASGLGGGEVKTIDDVNSKIGFTLYESQGDRAQSASVVMNSDKTEGIALSSQSSNDGSVAYALAFNTGNVLVQQANDYSSLGYVNNDQTGSCLSRTDFDETVHRYDLFDATTGAKVEINSGFSFKYDSDSDGLKDSYGHAGYWGIWTEGDAGLATGATVTVENRDENAAEENYTVVNAPGRLIKKSKETIALSDVAGIQFNYWDDSLYTYNTNNNTNYDSWAVEYKNAAFTITAGLSWGENGETVEAVTEVPLSLSANEMLHMHSNQLGGQVVFKQGDSGIAFFKEEFVNGSEDGTGELFENGSSTLHCLNRCIVGELGATELAQWDSAYETDPSDLNSLTSYSISNAGNNPLALVHSNTEVVGFDSNLTQQQIDDSPNGWGVQSGAMVTTDVKNGMSTPYDSVDVFYVWETGPNNWNKLSTVKDTSGNYASFDKPMQITYQHSDANDRSGDAGDYDGKTYMLNYGGNGDLWGLPYERDQNTDRHTALFNLADGSLLGSNNQYVVKALEIEGVMSEDNGACTNLAIESPAVAVPSSITGSVDIGDMPTVSDSPKVIEGVVQDAE